jgi:hypothetical protein
VEGRLGFWTRRLYIRLERLSEHDKSHVFS